MEIKCEVFFASYFKMPDDQVNVCGVNQFITKKIKKYEGEASPEMENKAYRTCIKMGLVLVVPISQTPPPKKKLFFNQNPMVPILNIRCLVCF